MFLFYLWVFYLHMYTGVPFLCWVPKKSEMKWISGSEVPGSCDLSRCCWELNPGYINCNKCSQLLSYLSTQALWYYPSSSSIKASHIPHLAASLSHSHVPNSMLIMYVTCYFLFSPLELFPVWLYIVITSNPHPNIILNLDFTLGLITFVFKVWLLYNNDF